MIEFGAIEDQTIPPGGYIVFYTISPCTRGLVRHREGTGTFLLKGYVPNTNRRRCCCNQDDTADYLALFKADVSVPEGTDVAPITLAITLDGAPMPITTMTSTPTAVAAYNNVASASTVNVWKGCCETVAIQNTSTIPINVRNASLIFSRPDLLVSR